MSIIINSKIEDGTRKNEISILGKSILIYLR